MGFLFRHLPVSFKIILSEIPQKNASEEPRFRAEQPKLSILTYPERQVKSIRGKFSKKTFCDSSRFIWRRVVHRRPTSDFCLRPLGVGKYLWHKIGFVLGLKLALIGFNWV